MVMIFYFVAECMSGIRVLRTIMKTSTTTLMPAGTNRDFTRGHRQTALFSLRLAEITVAFYVNGVRNVHRFDISHFDRAFGLSEGL